MPISSITLRRVEGIANGAMMFDAEYPVVVPPRNGKAGQSSFAVEIARQDRGFRRISSAASEKAGSHHINIENNCARSPAHKHYWEYSATGIRLDGP